MSERSEEEVALDAYRRMLERAIALIVAAPVDEDEEPMLDPRPCP